jgi:hypothetical protein
MMMAGAEAVVVVILFQHNGIIYLDEKNVINFLE